MTTSRETPPVLDLLITRNIMGASPGRDPFGQSLPGETATVPVWASRRDFPARDLVQHTPAGLVTIADSRYIVRAGLDAWNVGDSFTDEAGARRTVRGISQIGRGRHLELLARRVG